MGGFLSQAEGWRWVFWVIAIAVCTAKQKSSDSDAEKHTDNCSPVVAQSHL